VYVIAAQLCQSGGIDSAHARLGAGSFLHRFLPNSNTLAMTIASSMVYPSLSQKTRNL
jgi:hypothetical protein